jgi:hypothetical protein
MENSIFGRGTHRSHIDMCDLLRLLGPPENLAEYSAEIRLQNQHQNAQRTQTLVGVGRNVRCNNVLQVGYAEKVN